MVRPLINLILCMTLGLVLSSCVYDNSPEASQDAPGADDVQLILRISTVADLAGSRQEENAVIEKVKSLRVIILDDQLNLEANEVVQLPMSDYVASTFTYTYRRNTKSGKKHIFLVANEESVGKVMLTDATGLPQGLPLGSLTALLNSFKSESSGKNLMTALNRVYYSNHYSDLYEGKDIYLPYTAYYEKTLEYHAMTETEMHLVPVAAKFDFVFTNYRRENAQIDEFTISSLNTHNFLNAQLDSDEKTRELDEQEVWWIDWLQACAEASEEAQDPDAFDESWGWIKGYHLPVPGEQLMNLTLRPDAGTDWVIDALVDKANPSRLKVGPFYVPESIRFPAVLPPIDPGAKDQRPNQLYLLSFKVHDEIVDEVTTLSDYEVPGLNALFRATHVIVTVNLYESQVEIYVEIAPWKERLFLGYVQQETD